MATTTTRLQNLLESYGDRVPNEVRDEILHVCGIFERAQDVIDQNAKDLGFMHFRLKDTDKKIKTIHYDERWFELTN